MIEKTVVLILTLLFLSNIGASQVLRMDRYFVATHYYKNGNRIPKVEVEEILKEKDPEAFKIWKRSKIHTTASYLSIIPLIGSMYWGDKRSRSKSNTTLQSIGAVGSIAALFILQQTSKNIKRKAVRKYNISHGYNSSIHFGPTYNGLGFVQTF